MNSLISDDLRLLVAVRKKTAYDLAFQTIFSNSIYFKQSELLTNTPNS